MNSDSNSLHDADDEIIEQADSLTEFHLLTTIELPGTTASKATSSLYRFNIQNLVR